MISSSFLSIHEEIEKLKKIFSKNGYPSKFVDKCVAAFLNKLYDKKVTVQTVPKLDLMIVLPFLGTTSWKVKNDLTRTIKKNVPFAHLKIVFKSGRRLSSFFPFKDMFPKSLMSGVIYKFWMHQEILGNTSPRTHTYIRTNWQTIERHANVCTNATR